MVSWGKIGLDKIINCCLQTKSNVSFNGRTWSALGTLGVDTAEDGKASKL